MIRLKEIKIKTLIWLFINFYNMYPKNLSPMEKNIQRNYIKQVADEIFSTDVISVAPPERRDDESSITNKEDGSGWYASILISSPHINKRKINSLNKNGLYFVGYNSFISEDVDFPYYHIPHSKVTNVTNIEAEIIVELSISRFE